MVKYSPKYKHGKPVGRREVVEKFKAIGIMALGRAFNGGKDPPDHARFWYEPVCKIVNCEHYAIHARLIGYGADNDWYCFQPKKIRMPSRSILRRRAAKEAVRDQLLDFEDCEEDSERILRRLESHL